MAYEFSFSGSMFGDELDGLEPLVSAQIVAAASIGCGIECTTPGEFRDACAADSGENPEVIGVEVWDAVVEGSDAPTFTLIYFPDTDGGVLLHAGTTTSAGLLLWQHGFEPVAGSALTADPTELTQAYFAARAES